MPTRESILADETHKGQTDTDGQRIYYTLSGPATGRPTPVKEAQTPAALHHAAHRSRKALAELICLLVKRGALTQDDIDIILLAAVDRHDDDSASC